jgi:hypothetical protein
MGERVILLMLLALSPGLLEQVARSGRVLEIAETPSERVAPRVQIAPGAAPALAFRMLDGLERRRFGNLDLVLDDAGH